ncbi:MAG TPA: rhomboid family intramembrane serine protease [Terriglobia bacterium]|nr:rhomboid family intramembrane serine protease [Terriglobia bacterium]
MQLPPKVWFKIQRLRNWWRSSFGTKNESYDTSHRMCPECRALIARDAKVCPLCGAKTGPLRARGTPAGAPAKIMGVIPMPTSATSVLVAANVIMFAVEWFLTQRAGGPSGGGGLMGGISGRVMLRLGGKFGPLIYSGQWWRLVTAMFLHAGLLHIGFNLWCLFDLGPEVEGLFGVSKYLVLYLATGVIGFVVSLLWSPFALSIGASGAILGLIGILIGASFHHGHLGKEYRSTLWRWVIYIFIFGLFFNIDNAAHLGGLASGFMLGYLIPDGVPETRTSENLWNALAILSVIIIAGSFALMALQINNPIFY